MGLPGDPSRRDGVAFSDRCAAVEKKTSSLGWRSLDKVTPNSSSVFMLL